MVAVRCRLCASARPKYDIEEICFDMLEKIEKYFRYTVLLNKEFPIMACRPCYMNMDKCYKFIDQCSAAQEQLFQICIGEKERNSDKKSETEIMRPNNSNPGEGNVEGQVKGEESALKHEPINDDGSEPETSQCGNLDSYRMVLDNASRKEHSMGKLEPSDTALPSKNTSVDVTSQIAQTWECGNLGAYQESPGSMSSLTDVTEVPLLANFELCQALLDQTTGSQSSHRKKATNKASTLKPVKSRATKSKKGKPKRYATKPSNPVKSVKTDRKIYGCGHCTEAFELREDLSSHAKIHDAPLKHRCTECDKTYDKFDSFISHYRRHTKIGKLKCDFCDQLFDRNCMLRAHLRKHSSERPYVCSECGKQFKAGPALYTHRKTKHPESLGKAEIPIICHLCGKRLGTKQGLDYHLKAHSGEKDFICHVCGMKFLGKPAVVAHAAIHSNLRPFACDHCDNSFRSKHRLICHRRIHTDDKPFLCPHCPSKFREKDSCMRHVRIHTGEYKHECEICGKRFRFSGNFTIHQRTHTGEQPYSCKCCPKTFANWGNFNKHFKRRHYKEWEEEKASKVQLSC